MAPAGESSALENHRFSLKCHLSITVHKMFTASYFYVVRTHVYKESIGFLNVLKSDIPDLLLQVNNSPVTFRCLIG